MFSFLSLINNSVPIGLRFLLLIILEIMSTNAINTLSSLPGLYSSIFFINIIYMIVICNENSTIFASLLICIFLFVN